MAANALGKYLAQLCRERRISRRAASLGAGLNNAAISSLVRGVGEPSASTLVALARFFNVPAENLFRLAGYLPPIISPKFTIDNLYIIVNISLNMIPKLEFYTSR